MAGEGPPTAEDFARAAKIPATTASPFNYYLQPSPAQRLRVTIAQAFRRAVLRHAYTLLRGRTLDTGNVDPKRRDEQFTRLELAQDKRST